MDPIVVEKQPDVKENKRKPKYVEKGGNAEEGPENEGQKEHH